MYIFSTIIRNAVQEAAVVVGVAEIITNFLLPKRRSVRHNSFQYEPKTLIAP